MSNVFYSRERIATVRVAPDNMQDILEVLPAYPDGKKPAIAPYWFHHGQIQRNDDPANPKPINGYIIGGMPYGATVPVGDYIVVRDGKAAYLKPQEYERKYEPEAKPKKAAK